MAEQEIRQRQVAYKIRLIDIHSNELIKQEGWQPNYVMFANKKVSRVNVLGIVISPFSEEQNNIVIDDGGANIVVRKFDTQEIDLTKYKIGQVVNIVGKIREFNNEKYIMQEIIKEVKNNAWIGLRQKEIEYLTKNHFYSEQISAEKKAPVIVEEKVNITLHTGDAVIEKIKQDDQGEGVDTQSIINELGADSEKIINTLLEQGDIFATKPGKVKVLE